MEFNLALRSAKRGVAAPLPLLFGALAAGVVAQSVAQTVLDGFYARSGFPVPYYVGQLSFSARKLESWYAEMERGGTLDVYWQTQFVDFGFIAAVALLHTAALLLVARAAPVGTRWRRAATALVLLGPAAPVLDAGENVVSFVMLARPHGVSQLAAVVYSAAAAAKFAGFVAVYVWVPVGLAAAAVLRYRRRRGA